MAAFRVFLQADCSTRLYFHALALPCLFISKSYTLKYLRKTFHHEIKQNNLGNVCCCQVQKLLPSRLFSKTLTTNDNFMLLFVVSKDRLFC
jgi:hypothetical protein